MDPFPMLLPILLSGCLFPSISSMAVDHSIPDTTTSHQDDINTMTSHQDDINTMTNHQDDINTMTSHQDDIDPVTSHQDDINTMTSHQDDMTTEVVLNCTFHRLEPEEVVIRKNGLFLKVYNITVPSGEQTYVEPTLNVCFSRSEALNREIFKVCEKWLYEEGDFEDMGDGNVTIYGFVLDPGTYEIKDGVLYTCADEYEDVNATYPESEVKQVDYSIYMGQVGSVISIFALTAHLVSFCLVPSLRTLPGYNLAALSAAFIGGYFFSLFGQIPQVLGVACDVSGMIQQYFFLVAFFCMSTLSFDVWHTLNRATTKLTISSHNAKRRLLIYYSVYSWGAPIFITSITVTMNYAEGVPQWIRPEFGKHDTCWMDNRTAKLIFFAGPAFSLFVLNAIFFVMSAFTIKNNTMKCTSDAQKQTAKYNFVLYLRLGLMMGVTWIVGVIATIVESSVIWVIADLLTSLQGLFIFLMFSCSRKVYHTIKERAHGFKLADILTTPKTSTTDCPNSKGGLTGDTRTPKTSTTDPPNIKELILSGSRSPKTSTLDVPNLNDLVPEDTMRNKT